jgi:proline racemase
MGLVTAFIETGRLPPKETICLETPVDVVDLSPNIVDDQVAQVEMNNVESFVFDEMTVDVPNVGSITVEIVYSGIFFVMVDAAQIDLALDAENIDRLSPLALRIRDAVTKAVDIVNPLTNEPARVIDTQFYERGEPERSLVIYPDGSVDRSPCGTGTCAKATLFAEWGELAVGESFVNQSMLGTEFEGGVVERSERDGVEVIVPSVAGSAYVVADTTHLLDPADPLTGFNI